MKGRGVAERNYAANPPKSNNLKFHFAAISVQTLDQ